MSLTRGNDSPGQAVAPAAEENGLRDRDTRWFPVCKDDRDLALLDRNDHFLTLFVSFYLNECPLDLLLLGKLEDVIQIQPIFL